MARVRFPRSVLHRQRAHAGVQLRKELAWLGQNGEMPFAFKQNNLFVRRIDLVEVLLNKRSFGHLILRSLEEEDWNLECGTERREISREHGLIQAPSGNSLKTPRTIHDVAEREIWSIENSCAHQPGLRIAIRLNFVRLELVEIHSDLLHAVERRGSNSY